MLTLHSTQVALVWEMRDGLHPRAATALPSHAGVCYTEYILGVTEHTLYTAIVVLWAHTADGRREL